MVVLPSDVRIATVSEFEGAQLGGIERGGTIGVNGQRLACPTPQVLDIAGFDLG